MVLRAGVVLLAARALIACGDDGGDGEPPVFPADYAATYQEVRNCRFSLEHDLTRMRILASPEALTPYRMRNAPFPTGAIVLKEQYDSADLDCTGRLLHFTVMQKLEPGSSPDTLDWTWQKVSADHKIMTTDIKRCTNCHTNCGKPPEGYEGTCAVP
jgi:hypothetical protein